VRLEEFGDLPVVEHDVRVLRGVLPDVGEYLLRDLGFRVVGLEETPAGPGGAERGLVGSCVSRGVAEVSGVSVRLPAVDMNSKTKK
jgi:hypothetical protein